MKCIAKRILGGRSSTKKITPIPFPLSVTITAWTYSHKHHKRVTATCCFSKFVLHEEAIRMQTKNALTSIPWLHPRQGPGLVGRECLIKQPKWKHSSKSWTFCPYLQLIDQQYWKYSRLLLQQTAKSKMLVCYNRSLVYQTNFQLKKHKYD